jgi:hypothetical protein
VTHPLHLDVLVHQRSIIACNHDEPNSQPNPSPLQHLDLGFWDSDTERGVPDDVGSSSLICAGFYQTGSSSMMITPPPIVAGLGFFFVFFLAFFSSAAPDWYHLRYSFIDTPPAGTDTNDGGCLAAAMATGEAALSGSKDPDYRRRPRWWIKQSKHEFNVSASSSWTAVMGCS